MKKKLMTGIFIICMVLSLSACGQKELSPQEGREVLKEKAVQEEQKENPKKTLSDLVSMTGITITPIDIYSASVDSYEPEHGYVIKATVNNGNDISCDVSPVLSAVITQKDNYGKENSKEVVLLLSSPAISSPYRYTNSYGVKKDALGLAPHESKTIRYYIGANGGSNTRLDVAEVNNISDISSISDVKLQSLSVKEAEVIYLPVKEWSKDARIEETKFDFSTGNVISGTVTNNTEDRWKDGNIQFEIAVNGQTVNTQAIAHTYRDFTFVDIGGVIQLCDNTSGKYSISDSVASYENHGYKVELIPTILGYTPDKE